MPRYHFNVYHDRAHLDDEGEELPDKLAAGETATRMAGESIKEIDGKLVPGREWRMEVTDEFENPLWEIRVTAAQK